MTVLIFLLFPFARGEITLITLIAAATPIASSTAIFAQKFDQDYRQAVSYVCLSTIPSCLWRRCRWSCWWQSDFLLKFQI